jgi:hypothetical protein
VIRTRNGDPHVGAARGAIGQTHCAAVSARDELDDRESQARAAAAARLVGTAEAVEGAGPEVVRNAGAPVSDVKLDQPVPFLGRELDGAFAVREGVVYEVRERLPDAKRIGFDLKSRFLHAKLSAEVLRATGEAGGSVGEQIAGRDDLEPNRERALVGSGDEEEVFGEP